MFTEYLFSVFESVTTSLYSVPPTREETLARIGIGNYGTGVITEIIIIIIINSITIVFHINAAATQQAESVSFLAIMTSLTMIK